MAHWLLEVAKGKLEVAGDGSQFKHSLSSYVGNNVNFDSLVSTEELVSS